MMAQATLLHVPPSLKTQGSSKCTARPRGLEARKQPPRWLLCWVVALLALHLGGTAHAQAEAVKPDLYYFVVDRSGSIKFPNRLIIPITAYFTNQVNSIPAGSEIRLVFFNEKAGAQRAWPAITDSERAVILDYFRTEFQPEGGTRLYDTTAEALKRILAERESYGGVQLLVLTDGEDTASREFKSWAQVAEKAQLIERANPESYATVLFLGHIPRNLPPPPFKPVLVPNPIASGIPRKDPPPLAEFSITPTKAKIGDPVTFAVRSAARMTQAEWDAGDGTTIRGVNPPPHRYQKAGTYSVTLIVTGPGGSATNRLVSAVQVVPDVPLEARFRAVPNPARVGEPVQFVNDSFGGPTGSEWSFPGGVVKTAANPTHTFPQAGTSKVALRVTREDKTSSPYAAEIAVLPLRPKAEFSVLPAGRAARFGETVTLAAGSDVSGETHTWTVAGDETLRGREVRWTATNAGLITLVHTVEGPGGISIKDGVLLVDKPEAGFTVAPDSRQAKLGERFELRAAEVPGMEHHWTIGTNSFAGLAVTWEANQLGRIEARHTVSGTGGSNSSTEVLFIIPREGPDARFTVLPNSKQAMLGHEFVFTAGAGPGLSHGWKLAGQNAANTGPVFRWIATQPGRVEVEHVAMDTTGTNRHTEVVSVTNPPPPEVRFEIRPARAVEAGQNVTFAVVTPLPGMQYHFAVAGQPAGNGVSVSWPAGPAGIYEVALDASGPGGRTRAQDTILVTNRTLDAGFTVTPVGKEGRIGEEFVFKARQVQPAATHSFRLLSATNASVSAGTFSNSEARWKADKAGRWDVVHTVAGSATTNVSRETIVVTHDLRLDATAAPTSGTVPLVVDFKLRTQTELASQQWNFGDGTDSTQREPRHEFTKPGVYTVRVKVLTTAGHELQRELPPMTFTAPPPWWRKWVRLAIALLAVAALAVFWQRHHIWPPVLRGSLIWKYRTAPGQHEITQPEILLDELNIPGWQPSAKYSVKNHAHANGWLTCSKNAPHLFKDGLALEDLSDGREVDVEGVKLHFNPE